MTYAPRSIRLLLAPLLTAALFAAPGRAEGAEGAEAPPPSTTAAAPAAPPVAGPTAPAAAPRQVSLDIGLATQFPIMLAGVQGTLELPYRILAQAELGFLSAPYVDAIDGFLVAIDAYDDVTSRLIRGALGNSAVLRLSAGWRPFAKHGFEILGGYSLVALGGRLSSQEAIAAARNRELPEGADPKLEVPIGSTLHNVHAGVGWRWVFDDRWVLRASLQYLQTLSSSTRVGLETRRPRDEAAINRLNAEISEYMNDIYVTWVKSPVVGVSFAYRF